MSGMAPIIVVGAGPVGLTTALGLDFYRLPFALFEDDAELSLDTKAGTILTRTIEAFRRYGVADQVLAKALRVDEIGDVERATNTARPSVQTALLSDDTRYPFVINMPQHHLEPILQRGDRGAQTRRAPFTASADVVPAVEPMASSRVSKPPTARAKSRALISWPATAGAARCARSSACRWKESPPMSDACWSTSRSISTWLIRAITRISPISPIPQEWMILVRQPHCWRFLYPLGSRRSRAHGESSFAKRSFASSARSTRWRSSTPSSTASTIA